MNLCLLGLDEYIQQQAHFLTQSSSNAAIDGAWLTSERDHQAPGGPAACNECKQLRKEWQEMKQQFGSLQQLFCSLIQQQASQLAATIAPPNPSCIAPSDVIVPQTNTSNNAPGPPVPSVPTANARKRPAVVNGVIQPECPIAVRPVPSTNFMGVPNVFLHNLSNWPWNIAPLRVSSPPLNPSNTDHQLTSNNHVANAQLTISSEAKWSPSSVDSNNGDKTNIDIVGLDGSESSSSSVATQPFQHSSSSPEERKNYDDLSSSSEQSCGPNTTIKSENKNISSPFSYGLTKTEHNFAMNFVKSSNQEKRRKHSSDDYVKVIRDQQDLSEDRIAKIQIPVPEAIKCDPSFRAVSEQQIIQQMIQNKKFEETHAKESLVQLCKKLAEKRVFGAKLMSMTTVAGLNHSNYSNLPVEGIIYIQHVCRKVMGDKFAREEDFWDAFRDATKKLAARCRRVRHAKKTKSRHEEELLAARDKLKDDVLNSVNGSNTTSNINSSNIADLNGYVSFME